MNTIIQEENKVLDIFIIVGQKEYYAIGLTTHQSLEQTQEIIDNYFSKFVNLFYELYKNNPLNYEDFLLDSTSHFTLPTCKVFNIIYKKLKTICDDTNHYKIVVRPTIMNYLEGIEFSSNLLN